MINKMKQANEQNTKEVINNQKINENNDLVDVLKNELEISQEKIKDLNLNQSKEIFKIKNRLKIEVEKSKQFSLEKLITEFLPIIDNIEYAVNLIQKKKEKIYTDILKNMEELLSLIQIIFNVFQVSKINDVKVAFNPDIHEAISIKYTNEIKSNQIIEVMQSGYTLYNSRLLRPAMVVVSKNKTDNY